MDLALSGRDVAAYLERMDFFRYFGERVTTNADLVSLEERQRHNPGTLQELINFHTEQEIPGIVHRISEILENQGYRLRERVAICSVLSEVCANAAEHGRSSFGAYAAVQAYHHVVSGTGRRGEEVLISIADGGPGVRETLSRNPKYAEHTSTDNDALRHALMMGVSGTGEIGRGGGLALGGPDLRPRGRLALPALRHRSSHRLRRPQELPQRPVLPRYFRPRLPSPPSRMKRSS